MFFVCTTVQLEFVFLETTYNVTEANNQVDICLSIVSGLTPNRDVVVELLIENGTATG